MSPILAEMFVSGAPDSAGRSFTDELAPFEVALLSFCIRAPSSYGEEFERRVYSVPVRTLSGRARQYIPQTRTVTFCKKTCKPHSGVCCLELRTALEPSTFNVTSEGILLNVPHRHLRSRSGLTVVGPADAIGGMVGFSMPCPKPDSLKTTPSRSFPITRTGVPSA